MELYPRLQVRTTSDADMTTIFLRAEHRLDPRLEFKDGLAGLYEVIDKCVSVTIDGRLFAVMAIEAGGADFRPVWVREGFSDTTIRTVVEGWYQLATTAMTTRSQATS